MQAVQVPPQPVRREASSRESLSALIWRAISSKDTPAHSQRVIAGGTALREGTPSSARGRGEVTVLIVPMIMKTNSSFKR